jgi:hypothetical protein
VGTASGVGVGVATGVTTSLIGSDVPPVLPHAVSKTITTSDSHPAANSRIQCEAVLRGRGKAMLTYGFLDVMPVLGMVGTCEPSTSSWPGTGCCVPAPASAPVEGAPGAEGWPPDPFELGK